MDRDVRSSWFALSLVQQMLNIGNEVKRAIRFDSVEEKRNFFLDKAIRYTGYTMEDPKNKKVLPELMLSMSILRDYRGEHFLDYSTEQINDYYQAFQYLM